MRKIREMELSVSQMLGGRAAGCPGDSEETSPWALDRDTEPLRGYPQTTRPHPVKCPTLFNSMDCSPPGSSVHGILQARILEWVAIPFSRGSSRPRDWTQAFRIAGRFFTTEPPEKPQ